MSDEKMKDLARFIIPLIILATLIRNSRNRAATVVTIAKGFIYAGAFMGILLVLLFYVTLHLTK